MSRHNSFWASCTRLPAAVGATFLLISYFFISLSREDASEDSPLTMISDRSLVHSNDPEVGKPHELLPSDKIPYTTRAHWMRYANTALLSSGLPCPFGAFSSVIVNHTSQPSTDKDSDSSRLGTLICTGINAIFTTGNPTLHGEIAALNNCSQILQSPPYNLTPEQTLLAFQDLSIYTNAESCPMCASAIRWAGFREYVYGTSIETLIGFGWTQIEISSSYVFGRSRGLAVPVTRLVEEVLSNETDSYFRWQFDSDADCPPGCVRGRNGEAGCTAVDSEHQEYPRVMEGFT